MEQRDFRKTFYGKILLFSFVAGFLVHLFSLVQPLHNYDDIAVQPYGYGAGLTSGRWLLSVLGDFMQSLGFTYNLPLVNGLVFLAILAVSAAFLVSALQIRNQNLAILVGILFAVFPTAASTMYFKYTAPYYGLGILFSVLAAWILHRCRFSIVLSAILTALSLGIYQAYTPVTIGLFVLFLLRDALKGEHTFRQLLFRGISYCASLILGLLLYFLVLKLMFHHYYWLKLSSYQSLNTMGQISLTQLPGLLKNAFTAVVLLPMQDYCGIAAIPLLRGLYLMMAVVSLAMLAYILIRKVRSWSIRALVCLLCLVFPIAVNFIVIMCPASQIYTLMQYGFVLLSCLPLVVWDCLPAEEGWGSRAKDLLRKGLAVAISLVIFSYAYGTNVNNMTLYYTNRQVENYFSAFVAQVRMTEGFTADKEWAILGAFSDPLLESPWPNENTFGGTARPGALLTSYSRDHWLQTYIGYTVPMADSETRKSLKESEEVKAMPCWPDQGSIKVIGNTVVIKCDN